LPKKEFLMADISVLKTIVELEFLFLVILMAYISDQWTHKFKKRNFDGLHKCSKNYFRIEISFFSNFDSLHKQVM